MDFMLDHLSNLGVEVPDVDAGEMIDVLRDNLQSSFQEWLKGRYGQGLKDKRAAKSVQDREEERVEEEKQDEGVSDDDSPPPPKKTKLNDKCANKTCFQGELDEKTTERSRLPMECSHCHKRSHRECGRVATKGLFFCDKQCQKAKAKAAKSRA